MPTGLISYKIVLLPYGVILAQGAVDLLGDAYRMEVCDNFVILAQAGIQIPCGVPCAHALDSRLRENDGAGVWYVLVGFGCARHTKSTDPQSGMTA